MDVNVINTLLTSFGFPVVACIGMFYYLTKVMDKRDDKITETIQKITDVVNENSKLIAVFTDKMDMLFKYMAMHDEKGDEDDVR